MPIENFQNVVEEVFSFFHIVLPRLMGFFTGFPLLGTGLVASLLMRVVCAVGLSVFMYPILVTQYPDFSEIEFSYFALLKEFLIGWMSGFILTLPVWVSLMIGDIVESQRGGMATDNADPFTGVQSSVYGALIVSTVFMVIMVYHPFQTLITFLYKSYTIWPITEYFPDFALLDYEAVYYYVKIMFETLVLLAAPILLMMFLAEFGLALVNRFSPPLNVFILAMPLKSLVSIFVLWIFLEQLTRSLMDFYSSNGVLFKIVRSLFP